jgi:dihydrofolate reductase
MRNNINHSMNKPRISIIAAIGRNRELGAKNQLLWHIPGELKRFKEITTPHPMIMGRKTYESIGKPLPNRLNIIITRDSNFHVEGAVVVNSLEKALYVAKEKETDEIFIIGGGQIFEQALPITDRLYLTLVDADFPDADVFFPAYADFTTVISEESKESEQFQYKFLTLEKVT